jgi:uncharacterized protein (UPF0332 family)
MKVDIDIKNDASKGCTIVQSILFRNDNKLSLARKLQKSDFEIKKIIVEGIVNDYEPEKLEDISVWAIESIILDFQYNNQSYTCEINSERLIINPIFNNIDFLKRKLYECIVDPSSVYLQTAIENIESAELNLSMGNTRSASSDVYYAVHNLLKSIRYSYNKDENILTSDNHPPLFLAKIQLVNETDEEYQEKLKNSFNSELGKVKNWVNQLSEAINNLDSKFSNDREAYNQLLLRTDKLTHEILSYCEIRTENESEDYNISKYLLKIKELLDQDPSLSKLLKAIVIPIIATYEARVLGDYKFNFESIMSRKYIAVLFWFAEDLIYFVKNFQGLRLSKNTQLESKKPRITQFPIIANRQVNNSILGIIKVIDSLFDPVALKDRLIKYWNKAVSLSDWTKEYPIKLKYLEIGRAPLTVEIHEGNQIDVLLPYAKEKNTYKDDFILVEKIISDICECIMEEYPSSQLKISPITLTYQQKIIEETQDQHKNFREKLYILEMNIFNLLVQNFNTLENIHYRDYYIQYANHIVSYSIVPNDYDIARRLSNVLGVSLVRRLKVNASVSMMFVKQDVYIKYYTMFKEELEKMNIYPVVIEDDLWEALSLQEFSQKTEKDFLDVMKNFFHGLALFEAAATIDKENLPE